MTDQDYSPGQVVDGRTICGAKKRNGDKCGASPRRDATRCHRHGGNSTQAQKAARKRATNRRANGELKSLGYDPTADNINPAEALLRLVSDKAREVAWLRTMIDSLDPGHDNENLVWGKTGHEEGTGPLGPVDKDDYAADLNVWVRWLHQAEDQLAKYAAAALRAGVEQRQLEIREQEALLFVGAIHQILAALQLTTDQQKLVPEVVPAALRAIEGGTP